jgi:VIT1/CCC1 family predicted Fe2+/Mn2+ transporter
MDTIALTPWRRRLDPIERASEILMGVVIALTCTLSIRIIEGGAASTHSVLLAAIGSNLAWGLIDATMHLIATMTERARSRAILGTIRESVDVGAADQLVIDLLPPVVAVALSPPDVARLRERLNGQSLPRTLLTSSDVTAAAAIFLLVFLSTFPIVIPFLVTDTLEVALRTSNAIAIAMLFATGWSLGTYSGRSGRVMGLIMVVVGVVLVGLAFLLGG